MSSFNIPKVVGESEFYKSIKMTTVVCIIFIVMLVGLLMQRDTPMLRNHHKTDQLDAVSIDINNAANIPILSKFIVLTNINRSKIPVRKVVVMTADRQLHMLESNNPAHCKTYKSASGGIVMSFALLKEMAVSQIIIDVDVLDKSYPNIRTTQVELRDADNVIKWSYGKLLPVGDRQITVYVVEHKIIYDNKPQQILCGKGELTNIYGSNGGSSCNDQERRLTENIAINTWV